MKKFTPDERLRLAVAFLVACGATAIGSCTVYGVTHPHKAPTPTLERIPERTYEKIGENVREWPEGRYKAPGLAVFLDGKPTGEKVDCIAVVERGYGYAYYLTDCTPAK
jgi:hypothetical protein